MSDRAAADRGDVSDDDRVAAMISHESHWCEDCQADHAFDLAGRDRLHAEIDRLRARMAAVDQLFAGGPDTSCRTTWHDGMEYVEVPMADLRAAFDSADEERTRRLEAEAEVARLRAQVAAVRVVVDRWLSDGVAASAWSYCEEIRAAFVSGDEIQQ